MQHTAPQNVSLFYKAFKVCIVQVLVKGFKGLIVSLTMLEFHIILLLLMDFCICNFTCMQFTFQTFTHSFLGFLCYKTGEHLSFPANFSVL